jgi:hypothetical protein
MMRLGGEWYDGGGALLDNGDGSFLVFGGTYASSSSESQDMWLLKIDLQGRVISQRAIGNDWRVDFYDPVRLADGGFIIPGGITLQRGGQPDMLILKLNKFWDILWQKAMGRVESGEVTPPSMTATMDGGFVAAMDYWFPEIPPLDRITVITKFDADGNMLWQRGYYDEGRINFVSSIIETLGGELLAAGFDGPFDVCKHLWLMKLDGTGNIIWEERIETSESIEHCSMASRVAESRNGGFLIAGVTDAYGEGMDDMWILKIGEDGDIVWQRTLGDRFDDAAGTIIETNDGNIVVGGGTSPPEESFFDTSDAVIAKLDAAGNLLWQKVLSYRFLDDPYYWGEGAGVFIESSDGGIIFTGSVGGTSDNLNLCDMWVGKLTAEGEIEGGCDLIRDGDLVLQESAAVVVENSSTVFDVTVPVRDADATARDTSAVPTFLCQGM